VCDCYIDYCASCKRPIPMHLGDYRTKRFEIQVFCYECWKLAKRHYKGKRYVVWSIHDAPSHIKESCPLLYRREMKYIGERIVVVPLTDNAWKNRMANHPNLLLSMKAHVVGGEV